ncbi:MAG: DUF1513 domain-containing protein [Acidiferrobacterales bacterium]|nr:DUF1513 domain-containing protein [Acidiferrobacterales bacterium]
MGSSNTRRRFLGQCLATPLLLNFNQSSFANRAKEVAYIGAAQSRLGEHSLQCFNSQHKILNSHDIPSRGHGFAISQQGHIAAIARRPADFCLVLDREGKKITEFTAQRGRHFYGHGVFDPSGNSLFVTENDFENARGTVGVYDVRNRFQKVDEHQSYGIGPHMIGFDKQDKQLIIANGGIETHPTMGRKKLNLDTMQSSMAFVDATTGELVRTAQLPKQYHKNSLRHFSVAADQTVYIGLQNEGDDQQGALLAKLSPKSSTIKRITLPNSMISQLSNYVGDICLDQSEQWLLASSPYGNALVFFDISANQFSSLQIEDVCAVSATDKPAQFMVSSGAGKISLLDLSSGIESPNVKTLADFSSELAWDNHLIAVR